MSALITRDDLIVFKDYWDFAWKVMFIVHNSRAQKKTTFHWPLLHTNGLKLRSYIPIFRICRLMLWLTPATTYKCMALYHLTYPLASLILCWLALTIMAPGHEHVIQSTFLLIHSKSGTVTSHNTTVLCYMHGSL